MHLHRSLLVLVTAAAAVLVGAPADAGPPGKWTTISGPGIVNISEPGLHRTGDGALHVAIAGSAGDGDYIDVAHVSPAGALTGRSVAAGGWATTTQDPDLVGTPGGGMRLVFGGLRTTNTGDPYTEGYVYTASSDQTGASWTMAPNTTPAVADTHGYASYGTGVTSLADGTLVTAFPLNSKITYQVGNNAPQSFDVPDCCAYDMSLVNDGGNVYAAWYANGDGAANQGVFVRQLHPVLGPVMQAPGSVTGAASLAPGQAVAMVARAGGGVYLAYLKGYPTAKNVALWKVGNTKAKKLKGSKGARHVALSAGPGGRLWLAYERDDKIRAVHTNAKANAFGATRTIKTPKGSSAYKVGIEGSAGKADVVFNNGSAILHQQVIYGLTVKAKPSKLKAGKPGKVTFTVTDAGARVKGAKVKARGKTCKTNKQGKCTITFPARPAGAFKARATKKHYAPGTVRIKVRR